MSNARDKAQAFTKQLVGQMVGDDLLVQEGKEQEREVDREPSKDLELPVKNAKSDQRPEPGRNASRND